MKDQEEVEEDRRLLLPGNLNSGVVVRRYLAEEI
jgi:hypothetical protein